MADGWAQVTTGVAWSWVEAAFDDSVKPWASTKVAETVPRPGEVLAVNRNEALPSAPVVAWPVLPASGPATTVNVTRAPGRGEVPEPGPWVTVAVTVIGEPTGVVAGSGSRAMCVKTVWVSGADALPAKKVSPP